MQQMSRIQDRLSLTTPSNNNLNNQPNKSNNHDNSDSKYLKTLRCEYAQRKPPKLSLTFQKELKNTPYKLALVQENLSFCLISLFCVDVLKVHACCGAVLRETGGSARTPLQSASYQILL